MRILAVDDDPIILEILQKFVGSIPEHDLVTAECAADALVEISEQQSAFDCFLLDIQMPGTDGIELCKILREMPAYKGTPILMLTAMSEKDYIDRAFGAGATDYITKPFELNSLKGRLALVEMVAAEARLKLANVNQTETAGQQIEAAQRDVKLHDPFPIHDVDGVIENRAMENYVSQLSRRSLCGSVVLGFTIRQAADLFFSLSKYDFTCVITDVSEAISDCLLPTQRLVSYAGNGTFVCVVEGASHIDMDRLVDQINLYIRSLDLSQSNGAALNIRICAGRPMRLVWRNGDSAIDALRQAHISAEDAAEKLERETGSIWITENTA